VHHFGLHWRGNGNWVGPWDWRHLLQRVCKLGHPNSHVAHVQPGVIQRTDTDISGNGSQAAACSLTDASGGHANASSAIGTADPKSSAVADRPLPPGVLEANHDGPLCKCGYLPGMMTCRTRSGREFCPNKLNKSNMSGYCHPCRVSFGTLFLPRGVCLISSFRHVLTWIIIYLPSKQSAASKPWLGTGANVPNQELSAQSAAMSASAKPSLEVPPRVTANLAL
jgi:hypothetical protein